MLPRKILKIFELLESLEKHLELIIVKKINNNCEVCYKPSSEVQLFHVESVK